MDAQLKLKHLVGQTIVKQEGASRDSQDVVIETKAGDRYNMTHHQDCCEYVRVTYVWGLDNLLGKVEEVHEAINHTGDNDQCDSETKTTFTITTEKGVCIIEWTGTSNGYYSEDVSFDKI